MLGFIEWGGIEHAHRDNTKMDTGGWPLVMTAGS